MLRVGRKDGEIPGCDLQVFCCPKWRYVDPNRSFQPFLEILECPNMSNKNIFIPVKLISYDVHHPPMLFPKKSRRISYYFVCFSPPIFTPHSPPRWRHRTRDLRRKHHGIHGWQIRRLASSDGVGRQWLANKAGKGHRLSSAPWFGRVGFQVSMLGGGGTQKQRFCNPNHPQKKHTQRPKHQQQKKHAANTKNMLIRSKYGDGNVSSSPPDLWLYRNPSNFSMGACQGTHPKPGGILWLLGLGFFSATKTRDRSRWISWDNHTLKDACSEYLPTKNLHFPLNVAIFHLM